MLYRAFPPSLKLWRDLSLSFLFSLNAYAGDTPPSPGTVEMVNSNPQIAPEIPKLNPQLPYTGNQSQPSSDVGSSAGGSILNLLSDIFRVDQPDHKKLKADKRNADFQASLQKHGDNITAQFYPDLYEQYMLKKNPTPTGFSQTVAPIQDQTPTSWFTTKSTPEPVVTPVPTVVIPDPIPVPEAVVSTSTPEPVTAAITTAIASPSSAPTQIPSDLSSILKASSKATGGLAGTMPSLPPAPEASIPGKITFSLNDPTKIPAIDSIMSKKSYIKPMPVPPVGMTAPEGYTPQPTPAEAATGGAVVISQSGGVLEVAQKGAAWIYAAVCAHPYAALGGAIVGGVVSGLYFYNKRSRPSHPLPSSVHTAPTSHSTAHPNLPDHLQPSDNPLKLGKKISQPGPKPGQGDDPHGYKDQWGHYKYYTPENVQAAIESVEKGFWHGQHPKSGKHLYTYDCPKTGLQKWAEVDNNGEIMNCGINEVRHTFCPIEKKLKSPAGFKKPKGKDTGWVDKTLKAGALGSLVDSHYTSSTPLMSSSDESLPTLSSLPPAPRDITVHDLYAERMIKNHYVAMEQKKVEIIQNKINKGSNL